MAGVTFELLNDELGLRLEAVGSAIGRIAHQALREGGGPMLSAIKSHIHSITGLLAGGLALRAGKNDRAGRYSMLISSWTTREVFAMTRSSGVAARVRGLGQARDRYRTWYGVPVEFGHANARGGGRTPEHPFMRPGFDEAEVSTLALVEERLGEALDAAL